MAEAWYFLLFWILSQELPARNTSRFRRVSVKVEKICSPHWCRSLSSSTVASPSSNLWTFRSSKERRKCSWLSSSLEIGSFWLWISWRHCRWILFWWSLLFTSFCSWIGLDGCWVDSRNMKFIASWIDWPSVNPTSISARWSFSKESISFSFRWSRRISKLWRSISWTSRTRALVWGPRRWPDRHHRAPSITLSTRRWPTYMLFPRSPVSRAIWTSSG